jgi:hypothetical protein
VIERISVRAHACGAIRPTALDGAATDGRRDWYALDVVDEIFDASCIGGGEGGDGSERLIHAMAAECDDAILHLNGKGLAGSGR